MKITPLGIEGVWMVEPVPHGDVRGLLVEAYRSDLLARVIGHRLEVSQVTLTVSARDALRGVHFADVPVGQAKYVSCLRGAVLDVIVDVRVGSPTFGCWEAVRLDPVDRLAVYISEGLGHAYYALEDDTTVSYLCSTPYTPERERDVHPLDTELNIEWPSESPIISEKDARAPSLAEARAAGLLPDYEVCRRHRADLRRARPARA
ncbi:dTDP-4-dehydrorhamnose 3,5-epimerase family protein [Actinomadura chokoriensis]|uniref:dTDP-4-dehydrorhamnose 3,5-epimerase family protein n=1 Tax=Actinomadura chokoriensis TaxID=454156 RepID=A0ABV4R2T2_9ACTN